MYPNLRAEMARKGMTLLQLAEKLNRRPATISSKSSGKTAFTLDEALAIKEALQTNVPLEELFQKEEM